jgi:sulfite reductase alpha subunit-like flavoprotein
MADTQNGLHTENRSALILYGSETGNSEECAGDVGRMLERLHFTTSVTEMDNVEIVC